jgi:hypothetical protein
VLVALGGACGFAIKKFELSVRDAVAEKSRKDFFCPGSTIRASINNSHPFAYGMPSEGLILFWSGPAFEILPGPHNEQYETVVRYMNRDILQSGWLIGKKYLANKAAMVAARYGEGRVVLIGFRTQHRCQTHGTFKLFFNILLYEQ